MGVINDFFSKNSSIWIGAKNPYSFRNWGVIKSTPVPKDDHDHRFLVLKFSDFSRNFDIFP